VPNNPKIPQPLYASDVGNQDTYDPIAPSVLMCTTSLSRSNRLPQRMSSQHLMFAPPMKDKVM
jgi:hypothetical protein